MKIIINFLKRIFVEIYEVSYHEYNFLSQLDNRHERNSHLIGVIKKSGRLGLGQNYRLRF